MLMNDSTLTGHSDYFILAIAMITNLVVITIFSFVINTYGFLQASKYCNICPAACFSTVSRNSQLATRQFRDSPLYARNKKKSLTDEFATKSLENVNVNKESNEENPLVDSSLRAKLKAEIASPFYRLRQFGYTAMIIGGAIGTFTTVPQLILSLNSNGDVNPIASNLAIDLGASLVGILLWVFDGKNQQKKFERISERELKQSLQLSVDEASKMTDQVSSLPVEIKISEFNDTLTRIVSLGDLVSKGNQNVIIFAGKKSIVNDAIISARIEGSDLFTSEQTFIIPFVIDEGAFEDEGVGGKGFGANPLQSSPYFGKATQPTVWRYYLEKEIELAKKQGEQQITTKGLVLGIRKSDGKVVRRGIGIPPWRSLIDEIKKDK